MKKIICVFILNFLTLGLFAQTNSESKFTESEIVLKTTTGDIFGTLTVPNNLKNSPIVLIIAGSGPTDRNGNSPIGVNTNAYKMLAENLANNGISAVRYDKRAIAASKAAGVSEIDLRFDNYINDAIAWIELIKADKRFSKVIVLGHSEGSLIGMIAAERTNSDGYISVAGCGRAADIILAEQLKTKLPPQLVDESNSILDSLRNGKTVKKVSPILISMYRSSVQPYLISWMKYDPSVEIKKLKIPILILQGTTDIQVPVEDAKLLSAAKPDAKLVIIENMNHILKESEADMQVNMATYTNPDLPLKPELLDSILHFVLIGK